MSDPRCPRSAVARVQRARGMTLLEILVVLVIIGLIAGIAIPILGKGVSGTELRSAARQVAAGLRAARSTAVASRQEARLVLDLEHRTFRIDGDPREHALPKDLELKLFTAQRDLVSENTGAVRFFPDGGSNGGRITLASGERKFDVDVDWLTGRVAIAE